MGILQRHVPLELHEVPTGTRVFDWTVPKEWNIRDAYVKNAKGEKVIDFRESNLHVLNYSVPVRSIDAAGGAETASAHPAGPSGLDSLPDVLLQGELGILPEPQRTYLALEDGDYEVCIDSTLEDGSLTYGELILQGTERTRS